MAKTKKLKLNAPLRGILANTTITIRVDKQRNPVDKYWRDRIKDSSIDHCVEIVKDTKPRKAENVKAETKMKGV